MNAREKILQIMDAEKISAKLFAEKVGIQAGTISNIMSGRNNPSLEVIQKILLQYPAISSDWLVLDKGSMYRKNATLIQPTLFDHPQENMDTNNEFNHSATAITPAAPEDQIQQEQVAPPTQFVKKELTYEEHRLNKIILLYTDGKYEER